MSSSNFTTALHVTSRKAIVACNDIWGSIVAVRTSVNQRVQKHRVGLRAAGLRPIQIWVPDTRKAGFAAECRKQCLTLRKDASERKTLKWLASVADTEGWK
jgi:Protein  of unknown function (DUF3018)